MPLRILASILLCVSSQNFAWCQSLFVSNGESITVNPGTAVYVGSDITNNGSIDLKASAGSYAQLKFTGTYSGTGTFSQQQHLINGWHLIASSVSNGYNASSNASTSALYAFNTDLLGGNPGYVTWSTSYNEPDRGYYAKVGSAGNFMANAGLLTLTGAPNTGTTARTVGQTAAVTSNGSANGSGTGWNLLGNPYPCGLDWYSYKSATTPAILNSAVYLWDPSAGSGAGAYTSLSAYVTGAVVIPPMQAFWVQVFYPPGGSLPSSTMSAHGVLDAATFYKNLPPRLDLVVTAAVDTARSDRSILADVAGSALAFEGETDAWKLRNGAGMPNLMSRDDATGQELSINALELSAPGVIPIAFACSVPGEKWVVRAEGDWSGDVMLEDRLLGTFTDLRAGEHTFVHAGWTLEESRFRLHYVPAAALGEGELDAADGGLIAYAADEWVWVRSSGDVAVVAMDGRVVARSASADGIQRIPRPGPGIYVVRSGSKACKIWVP
ncbi:MAG: hypothetical protein RLZZ261_98 [Bacteroidota bacterium]